MGLVYILQPSELVGTDRYKIGRSSKSDLSRVRSYKNGSRYLCIMECIDDIYVERLLIIHFNKTYNKIAGNEYFQGDELYMLNSFINIVMKYKNKILEKKKQIEEIQEIPEALESITDNWMLNFKYNKKL